jgi:thiamine pyrophosphokinase
VRALIVAAAPTPGSAQLVAKLSLDHDVVIAVDGGGEVCIEAGVTPDLVLGDFDSLDPAALDWLRRVGVEVEAYPADKDQTDLELALDAARTRGADRVTVTAVSSHRLDHTLAAMGAIGAAADLWPEIVEPEVHVWVLGARARSDLRVLGVGATMSLVICGNDAVVSVSGVRWPLAHQRLPSGTGRGVSNIITDEVGALVAVHSGTVFVIAPETPEAVRVEAK